MANAMASLAMATSARVHSTAQAGSRTSIPARSVLAMGKTLRLSTFVPSNALRASSVSRKSNTPRAGMRVVALAPEMREAFDKFVTENKIVLFMKGNKQFPQCGFSNTTVQILNTFNVPYETVDILAEDSIRQGMKEYSSWPTFPQVYIDGEFYGGCDIMIEAYQNGELQETIEKLSLE
mmetsp:Transcript_2969/g.5005  ORF Transcript_2969/g.5005 Transcript_2969/m.5005 type:complete len:179 (+) Transcript_2969:108-644(+)|eukprot:CAMPEP_0198211820 /NCGR_PEP_ID=MMETSP1445-20131203/25360_1 /TAXON_ID=36898 /ORGANISM="Pyramimonas sp., Strain CCMP2087" /LENGTH=178 /DNA_ID=CAMNT_0043886163 /DNA_START=99 /DNA_END=635 /DNA_ORIENTATION=-